MSKVESRPPNKTLSCGEVRRTSRKLACKSQNICSKGRGASNQRFYRKLSLEGPHRKRFGITELFFFSMQAVTKLEMTP